MRNRADCTERIQGVRIESGHILVKVVGTKNRTTCLGCGCARPDQHLKSWVMNHLEVQYSTGDQQGGKQDELVRSVLSEL